MRSNDRSLFRRAPAWASAALIVLSGAIAASGSARSPDPVPQLALPASALEQQARNVRIDPQRNVVDIDGRALAVGPATTILVEDPRTGQLQRAASLSALASTRPERVAYRENADGTLALLIVLQGD